MYALSGSAVAQLTPLVQRSGADSWNSAFGLAEKRWEIPGGREGVFLLCAWNSPHSLPH